MNEVSDPELQRLRDSLAFARRELIDLSRRNRLLHAPRTGKRPHCLEIIDANADDLFAALARTRQHFRFLPTIPGDGPVADDQTARTPGLHQLQTKMQPEPLERRLLKLFREARTFEEEQGANILFLAIGFLTWFEDGRSQEPSSAPLLLVPVMLERQKRGGHLVLRGREDDLVLNVSLAEKLRGTFGVSLPDIPDGDEWLPSAYMDAVADAVAGQNSWSVDRNAIGLGFFTFSQFLMWRDLEPAAWPDGRGLLENPLVARLLGQKMPDVSDPPLVSDDESVDARIDFASAIHVRDADSSQAVCIEEVRQGRNLVIQGPPGTGKSQTITNMIAAAVREGKSVLFVAEKAAALDVVHDRLKSVGLGPLCLEMHSRKATKNSVLASIDMSIRAGGAVPGDGRNAAELRDARDSLNECSAALHHVIRRSGRSAYQVIGTVAKLRADNVRVLEERLDAAANWDQDQVQEAERAVARAAAAVTKLQVPPFRQAWYGTHGDYLTPFDADRLRALLSGVRERLAELISLGHDAAALLQVEADVAVAGLSGVLEALRLVARVPEGGRGALIHPAWRSNRKEISRLIECGRRWTETRNQCLARFVASAWKEDVEGIRRDVAACGGSIFRFLNGRYRRAIGNLNGLCRDRPPKRLTERLPLLDQLISAQETQRKFEEESEFGKAVLGPLWASHDTAWQAAEALLAWTDAVASLGSRFQNLVSLAPAVDRMRCSSLAERLDAAISRFSAAYAQAADVIRPDGQVTFGAATIEDAALASVEAKLGLWAGSLDTFNDWVDARLSLETLRQAGLAAIADGLASGNIAASEASAMVELVIAEALWRCACADNPGLAKIDGAVRDETVTRFRSLDRRRIVLARLEVLASYLEQRPTGSAGEMGVIRAEIEKKSRHLAIRKLMEGAGSALQRLKPVFLMSPLSVAQFLPPGRIMFDLVLIDEASQVPPEGALGAIARAHQMVVVGDDKQLPPTNFFRMASIDDEDESEDDTGVARPESFESILTLARASGIPERALRWHYRSRHPSLIALSNHTCYRPYGRSLLLPPSPWIEADGLGLSFIKTPRGHYDRGGSGRNPVEAELIAVAVEEHISKRPGLSLGIGSFSIHQRDAIEDAFQRRGLVSAVEAFAPKGERLFVKSLEAIQGDERDVIFISIGYGPDQQGRMTASFGPVSQDGGERRLNVLISRARVQCVVFSSITAGDIRADVRPRGTQMLREFLHFAETGHIAAGDVDGGDFDSPFEEAVAMAIRQGGYDVVSQVGVAGFRIDLGVRHPAEPGRFILGVECDGASYHSGRSARDRDRLRQEVLEDLGWRLHRIWSTDWFRHPSRETKRLLAAIEGAVDAGAGDAKPRPYPKPQRPEIGDDADSPDIDDQSEPITADPEASLPHSLAIPYVECKLTPRMGIDFSKVGPRRLSDVVVEVVAAEGPVHIEEIAKRVREAFGLGRTGRRILEQIAEALDLAGREGRIVRQGEFWSCRDRALERPRSRRYAESSLRRADRISPDDYKLAILATLRECVALARQELVVETARVLGFDRTGNDLDHEISVVLDRLAERGEIRAVDGMIHLAATD